MKRLAAFTALVLVIASPAIAQTLDAWTATQTSQTTTVLTLHGSWPNGCPPSTSQVTRTGFTLDILLPAVTSSGACTAVITPYNISVTIAGLDAGMYTARIHENLSAINTPLFATITFSVSDTFVVPALGGWGMGLLVMTLLFSALPAIRRGSRPSSGETVSLLPCRTDFPFRFSIIPLEGANMSRAFGYPAGEAWCPLTTRQSRS